MQYWLELLPDDARTWIAVAFYPGLFLFILALLFAGWFRDWWLTNILRNRLEAKRRLRREGREPDVKP